LQGFRFAGWELNLRTRHLISADGERIALTLAELAVLRAFLEAPQRVLSRKELAQVSHGHSDEILERSIDVLILRLRRKLEIKPDRPAIIKTSRGTGYYLTERVKTIA
jgi:DNA-binding response OmpR family regulator